MIRSFTTAHPAWMKKMSLCFITLFLLNTSAQAQQQTVRQWQVSKEQRQLSAAATFTDMVSVGEQSSVPTAVLVYPNPCTNSLYISAANLAYNKNYTYSIMNLSGQIVASGKTQSSSSSQLYIPVPETLSKGTYVMSLGDESLTTIATEKIMITTD